MSILVYSLCGNCCAGLQYDKQPTSVPLDSVIPDLKSLFLKGPKFTFHSSEKIAIFLE